jgi:hypothetical protein
VAEKVTLAEAKALGFNSTKGITKEGGMYKFAESLAPERGGFQSVGVAKPGEVQMTPYYGDVTGSYRLTQEQYASATSGGKVNTAEQARIMQENEIKALIAQGLTRDQAIAKVSSQYGKYGISGSTVGGYDSQGNPTPGGQYNAQGQFVGSGSTVPTVAQTEAQQKRQNAFDILYSQFSEYGLQALVEPLKNLILEDVSPSEFAIRLRQTEPYKKRFAANAARINKGLKALSEDEYLALEDGYQSIMRNYGLPATYYSRGDLGRQEGFEKLIAGDVSPAELEDRIATAQNRVLNAAPEVTTALRKFYPDINNADILAYTLDPEKGLTDIKRKITAAEIGGAALAAGLNTSLTDAEYLRRYGVTAETARRGYGIIGSGLERGRQLASIYQQPDYTQAVAEEEVFELPGQTEAQQKRKKIIGLEKAEFGGKTGITSGALATERAGAY